MSIRVLRQKIRRMYRRDRLSRHTFIRVHSLLPIILTYQHDLVWRNPPRLALTRTRIPHLRTWQATICTISRGHIRLTRTPRRTIRRNGTVITMQRPYCISTRGRYLNMMDLRKQEPAINRYARIYINIRFYTGRTFLFSRTADI